MGELFQTLLQRPNFVVFVILFLWGIYIMAVHPNLVKKLIGLYIVQTSAIYFLVAFSAKDGATVPIILEGAAAVDPSIYANPLPHVLTVTAIVVQVATLGVSLALVSAIYRKFGTLDEDELMEKLK
ncbi:MAG: cation:proton antiporter subunit C [Proteobacteria bacterium]|jgi:multicomponent Na+:H+ antiporter subunit C|nr:cation:proton antiporter subunit C [Pseudomonadota bacterium]MDA1291423.1 cation:proton antiporter subunit C [Pseudomonadota bacterium]